MRNFFTQLFLIVLMVTLFGTSGYAVLAPNTPPADVWPDDNSTTQLQPGSQTLTVVFAGTNTSNTVWRLNSQGIISLNAGPGGTGNFQQETLQIGEGLANGKIMLDGNTIRITFAHLFVEDAFYYVTISDDAIQFMDRTFFTGLGYNFGEPADISAGLGDPASLSFDDAADWGFQVDDITPPLMEDCAFVKTAASDSIENGDKAVQVTADTVFVCFSEPLSWVGGNPLAGLTPGQIAFYHAYNPNLDNGDPYGEFGGDVLYQKPSGLILSPDGLTLKIVLSNPAVAQNLLKYAARGTNVWPADADIYLRFASGLLQDRGGNVWTGVDGSPFDPYTIAATKFWFTTRDDAAITRDIWPVYNNTQTVGHSPLLWNNDDFVIRIDEIGLTWKSGANMNDPITPANAPGLIQLLVNGNPVAFTINSGTTTGTGVWNNGTQTFICIHPTAAFPSDAVVTVRLLGNLVWDLDLVDVLVYEETFTAGDFDAPVFQTSINNILCTNFDLRAWDADEDASVFYALIDDSVAAEHPGWHDANVKIEDIYNGYMDVDDDNDASHTLETRVYFNHVADPVGAGPYTYGSNNLVTWQPDSFNINTTLVAFEHIDDFVGPNHGKTFRVFYFGFDTTDQGPYAAGFETTHTGQATDVGEHVLTLSDCLPPEHIWHFESVGVYEVDDEEQLYAPCGWNPTNPADGNIKKQGKWSFQVPITPEGIHVDELYFVDGSLSWADQAALIASGVFKLEVSTNSTNGIDGTWTQVEIASIQYINDKVIVTPLNSYPSAGKARIILRSGSIMDKHGNAINQVLTCWKQVESYCDPYIKTLTVQTKSLLFPTAPEFAGLNGVVALVNGQITVEFNNPMYTPERDETNTPVLEPINEVRGSPVVNLNWIGNYIKVREGNGTDANVTDNVIDGTKFTYTITRNTPQQGITKVVLTPIAPYKFKSENWYYVEVESLLQDENRRELSWHNGSDVWDNNIFIDPHHQFINRPTTGIGYDLVAGNVCEAFPSPAQGNSDHYFMKFRTEDDIAPVLQFTFNKIEPEPPVGPGSPDYPYIAAVDEDLVSCINRHGKDTITDEYNEVPIGVIINEWSQMGFDDPGYYVNVDPNGLRPYFKLTNTATGANVDFDIVVLDIIDPTESNPYSMLTSLGYTDAVWFGFRPFTTLAEGVKYKMEFTPTYQAPGSALDAGSVFVDDNGNELTEDTMVEFITCVTDNTVCVPTSVIGITNNSTINTLTPGFSLRFDRTMDDVEVGNINCTGFFTIDDGAGNVWESHDATLFYFDDPHFEVDIPWQTFLTDTCGYTKPGLQLAENTNYTLTVKKNSGVSPYYVGGFVDRNNETLSNCEVVVHFKTPDRTPPGILTKSPDIDTTVVGQDKPGTYDLATAINPRHPGNLKIRFNEKVNLVPGKLVEIWQHGDTRRAVFTSGVDGTWDAVNNTWTVPIPVDLLQFNSNFNVDVEAGFVVDLEGNAFAGIGGWEDRITVPSTGDGIGTWTFQTGSDIPINIVATTPYGTIDPYSEGYTVVGDSVIMTTITIELTEGANAAAGVHQVSVHSALPVAINYLTVNASQFVPNAARTLWTYTIPGGLKIPYNGWTDIVISQGAFVPSWGPVTTTPLWSYANSNPAEFRFKDLKAPTAEIWPVSGDTCVAFNTHAYVRFSESLIAKSGSNMLVVTQANLKSWIKVYDNTGGDTLLHSNEYVCEFIDLARKHVRVTFLDEHAPAIGGITANLIDENQYSIVVNALGDGIGDTGPTNSSGYTLQDPAGNVLVGDSIAFTTEDITAPNFYVTTCDVTASSIKVWFTPWDTINPHLPTVRTYPAEAGKVFYIVLPASATPPTANQLFNKTLTGVQEMNVSAAGDSVIVALPPSDVPPVGGYNFIVYAVMQDDEVDIYIPPTYGDAWIQNDNVFRTFGDWPTGIADIRPAPNKNTNVKKWQFCACDDDKPAVVSKGFHQNMNVPVDSHFDIIFDEHVALGPNVDPATGIGTGGLPLLDPNGEFGYEIRLRYWNNNVAVALDTIIVHGDTVRIVPAADLPQETKFYIEIDRKAIRDVRDNCVSYTNTTLPQDFTNCYTSVCAVVDNYFDGWVGRWNWWFKTNDNTPPVLTHVSPVGDCVDNTTNHLVFTFKEKNEMIKNILSGASANIFIYKHVNHAIPWEIVPVSTGVIANPTGDTWTITYTIHHIFNSEEQYDVEWNGGVFTDNAIPTPWHYDLSDAGSSTDVADDGGDAGAPWDMFTFTTRDNLLPVFSWALMNTVWQNFDDGSTTHPEYVYQIPNGMGSWDPNDAAPMYPSPKTINTCGDQSVPHKVQFYVWTNEDVAYSHILADLEDPFFLEVYDPVSGWIPVSLEVADHGSTGTTLYGNVPVTNNWWVLEPHTWGDELKGSTQYRFGINGGQLNDIPANDCDSNLVAQGKELFNFCTWNTDPAEANLADGCANDITPTRTHHGFNHHHFYYVDSCICEAPYFDLCFDKVVVKAAGQAGVPITVPGAPWFTWANLLMSEADLMDTNDGPYIDFRKWGTSTGVVIDSVKTYINGVELSSGATCNCTEGALCYRLYVHGGLEENTKYVFEVKEDVLKDQTRIPNGNLFPGQTWKFYTRFNTAPFITAVAPPDEATNVSPTAILYVAFNRDVVKGNGHLIVRDNGNPQGVVLNVAGTDARVSIVDNVVTISHLPFQNNTTYYVEVMNDFVRGKDCDMIPFAGDIEQGLIVDRWNFRTGDNTGPVARLWPNQNPHDYTAECVAPVTNLTLKFDENIVFDTTHAELVIYKALPGLIDPVSGQPNNSVFGDVVERIPFRPGNFPQVIVSGTNPANGLTADSITVIPATTFISGQTYYIRIEGDGINSLTEGNILNDQVGNPWNYPRYPSGATPLHGIHFNDWWFKIANNSAPMLTTTTLTPVYGPGETPAPGMIWGDVTSITYPERGATLAASQLGAGVTTNLVMDFNMDVQKGAGKIQIWEFIESPAGGVSAQQARLWKEINVQTANNISINGNVVTISNVWLLDGIHWYYVLAAPGTFTSTVPCVLKQWAGIVNPDTWMFSTAPDITCPQPIQDGVAITSGALDPRYLEPATVNFEITFTEPIAVLWSPTQLVQILDSDGGVVAEATINPATNISGNVLSLSIDDFDASLMDQSSYTLFIPSNSITDMATNSTHNMLWPVPGTNPVKYFGNVPGGHENFLCADISVDFETGDFTAPEIDGFGPTVTCLGNEVEITAHFTEPVIDGPGVMTLVEVNGKADDVVLDAALDEDPAPDAVKFSVILPDSTNWYVLVAADFVTDEVYMGSADGTRNLVPITDPAEWTFGIGDNILPVLLSWVTPDQDIANLDTTFAIVLTYDDDLSAVDITKAHLSVGGNTINDGITAAVIENSNQVRLTVTGVADQTEYMLELDADFVTEAGCNGLTSAADEAGPFIVGDLTKPVLEVHSPETARFNALGSYIGVNIEFAFSDDCDSLHVTPGAEVYIQQYTLAGVPVGDAIIWNPELSWDAVHNYWIASNMPDVTFGYVTVFIPAGTIVDCNGNTNDVVSWEFWIEDTTPPGPLCLLSVSPYDGEQGILSQPNLIMEFCERMASCTTTKYVSVYELNSTGTNVPVAHIAVTPAMIDGTTVTIPLDGTTMRPDYNIARPGTLKDNQDYIVMAEAGSICDEAGNPWVGIDDPTKWNWTTGDNTAPTAMLQPVSGVNQPNTVVVRVTFSEPVVDATDLIEITGKREGTTPVWTTINDRTYTVAVTGDDLAEIVITVPTTITDIPDAKGYGNPLAAEVTGTYVIGDNTQPEVSWSAPEDPQLNTFDVVLTFTEPVQGVDSALTVTGGTYLIDGVDGDSIFTVTITAVDEAVVGFVLDQTVTDMDINENPLKAGLDLEFNVGDHVIPTYTVDPETLAAAPRTFMVDIAFTEEVEGVAEGITVAGATSWDLAEAEEANAWTLTITAPDLATVTVDVASSITDGAPSFNPVAAGTFTYHVGDNTPPTVRVVKSSATDTVNVFDVTITFNEMVTGVDETSVTIDGHAASMDLTENIEGRAYEATLSGADGDTLTLSFSSDIKDLAGNSLVPVSFVYTIADTKAPTVVASPASGINLENTNTVRLTFSEDVVNVQTGVIVAGATTSGIVMVRDSVYDVTYTAVDKATVTITVPAAVKDWKGNSIVPVTFTYVIDDNTAPEIESVVPETADSLARTFDVVVTFTEPVWGAADGITVDGGTAVIAGVDGDAVYTVTITGADWAEITMTIPTTIVDGAGVPNALAAGGVYEYSIGDNTPPTVVITDPVAPVHPTFTVGLAFNEDVQGVETGVVGGTVTKIDDQNYTVSVTGAEKTTVELTLTAAITDMSGNALVPVTRSYTIGDFTKPTATVDPASATAAKNSFPVTITFDEDVTGIAGAISVAGGTMTTPVVVGNTATLTLGGVDGATVTMMIANTVTDLAGNTYAGGIFAYVIGDNTPPTMVATAAADPQATTFHVTLTFNEPVNGVNALHLRAIGGTITNINGADGASVYVVTITGDELADVTLQVSNLVKDISGNAFAGASMNYHIGDFTAPTATLLTPTGPTGDDTTFDLVMTMSENVVTGTGTMVIYNGGVAFRTIATSEVTIVGNKVSVHVSMDKNTTYWVYVTPGFVKDPTGNAFAGITIPSIWTFTTGNFATGSGNIPNIQFKVYPNPFNDYIKIDNADKLTRVVISNIAGQSVIDVMYPGQEVRTPNLVSGVYIATLFTEDGIVKTERIVKR